MNFKLKVQCPNGCKLQSCNTIKQRKCVWCRKTFEVAPKNSKSRIVRLEKGNLKMLQKLIFLKNK